MPLGTDNSVKETAKFDTVNNQQPTATLKGLTQAGESEGGLFGTLIGTLGLGDDLTAVVKEGAKFKLKKELGLLPPKPKEVVTTTNKTVVKADKDNAKTVLQPLPPKNNLIYFLGGAGVLVIAFALIAKGR